MIYDITVRDRGVIRKIDASVGKPNSYVSRFFGWRSISSRMIIMEVSENLKSLINREFHFVSATIEVRTDGIVVNIQKEGRSFAWPISFDRLQIDVSGHLKIATPNSYLVFSKGYKKNKEFIDRLLGKVSSSRKAISA